MADGRRMQLGWLLLATLSVSIAGVPVAVAQRAGPLAAPPSQLAPPPALPVDNGFDSFASPPPEQPGLNPFHTRGIPFASWSSDQRWPSSVINSRTIARHRNGFYQQTRLAGGWIPRDGNHGLGSSYFRGALSLALGKPGNVVLLTPALEVDWLRGPTALDVPGQLYATYLDVLWQWKFSDRWGTVISARPGVYSDFQVAEFRPSAFAVLSWEVIPDQLTVYGGAVYLNRNDYDWLPAGGLIWTPGCDWRVDLLFPKPKVSWRVGHIPYVSEDWIYLAAGFGGGTFPVQRVGGGQDELTLRDYRVSLGIERIVDGGSGWFVESGWVFGRRLEYLDPAQRLRFDDSLVIEAGFSF